MANPKTIAGLIGPTLIALAAALLINFNSISALIEPVSHDPALVIVSGVLSFVAGLAVVRVHNHWAGNWTVIVTILGVASARRRAHSHAVSGSSPERPSCFS